MAKLKKVNQLSTPKATETFNRVKAGFMAQGKSFNQFCDENNVDKNNARRALLGTWKGKNKALRDKAMEASKAHLIRIGA